MKKPSQIVFSKLVMIPTKGARYSYNTIFDIAALIGLKAKYLHML